MLTDGLETLKRSLRDRIRTSTFCSWFTAMFTPSGYFCPTALWPVWGAEGKNSGGGARSSHKPDHSRAIEIRCARRHLDLIKERKTRREDVSRERSSVGATAERQRGEVNPCKVGSGPVWFLKFNLARWMRSGWNQVYLVLLRCFISSSY